jgi:tetratricopeptide (TPR) repeat protein
MNQRERNVRQRYQRAIAQHRRRATAKSWFTLGVIVADAFVLSSELGRELAEDVGGPVACWRQCVKLAPSHADAWHHLGQAYYVLEDHPNATRALSRAVKLDPRDAIAWNQLAVMTLSAPGDDLARVRRAERFLQRAIEADPRGKKLGWEPYAWLAETAERLRDDPGALAWYAEANRRGDKYAAARKQVIENHGARRRATKPVKRPVTRRVARSK